MTEGRQLHRLFRVTPPLGPAYGGEHDTPTLRLACGTPFSNTQEGPDREQLRKVPRLARLLQMHNASLL